ncbi:peroxisomal hydratase-dehydrogenase-epimerase [Monosporozyma unispora]|nr:bifunctional hydroxyacyl-CoA dehydrogenase/enoyl-CoA hydratase fox2 [Kazachstania unispora]
MSANSKEELNFKGRVVVITGAGGGLGRHYALDFAQRGAKVVVNDLGGTLGGAGHDNKAADLVVKEIKEKFGGEAVANYDAVGGEQTANIIDTAIKAFGKVDIIINNAGILRDTSFAKMDVKQFNAVVEVHLTGAYKLTKAAWPYMREQKFGRVINTASPAGLYGNFGQANYSAAKLGLVGFAETLAKEGFKYNINVNSIAPLARSRMTEDVLPPHILKELGPEKISPLVLYLSHESTKVTNSIFELAAGYYGQIRWERSSGQIFNPNEKYFTPEAILHKWKDVNSFDNKPFKPVEHPFQLTDYNDLIVKAKKLPIENPQGNVSIKSLKDKVVIITGAGGGLGRSHAIWFAKYGAKVVINDIRNANTVVDELNNKYGKGTAVPDSHNIINESQQIIDTALKAFGRVDVLCNNAGILRDKSFLKMTDQDWNDVLQVHLYATYSMCKSVWPVFLKQKSGYIINTTSTSGIYGNFGQANYAAAKAAILGFSKTLAIEGLKKGIRVNIIAPHAETAMTKTIFGDKELQNHFDAGFVSPLVVLLASEELHKLNKRTPINGMLYEVGGGWIGQTRWQRGPGFVSRLENITPEVIRDNWNEVVNFTKGKMIYPTSTQQSSMAILQAVQKAEMAKRSEDNGKSEGGSTDGTGASKKGSYHYNYKDCILYNIGVGATSKELKYVYENDPEFQVLPTFAVIPSMNTIQFLNMDDLVDDFNFAMLLHGEQYFKIYSEINRLPTSANLRTEAIPLQVQDKGGKAAIIVGGFKTYDADSGKLLMYNEGTFFIRGAHLPSGAKRIDNPRSNFATEKFSVPNNGALPDLDIEITTSEDLASIYRLSGDYNPLHIDPVVAKSVKFPKPILHGLCTMGITGKALYEKFGPFEELKVRFTNVVIPGDVLKIKAWKKDNGIVVFQTIDKNRNVVVLDNSAIRLKSSSRSKL